MLKESPSAISLIDYQTENKKNADPKNKVNAEVYTTWNIDVIRKNYMMLRTRIPFCWVIFVWNRLLSESFQNKIISPYMKGANIPYVFYTYFSLQVRVPSQLSSTHRGINLTAFIIRVPLLRCLEWNDNEIVI